jgi:hypothetical protein
MPFLLSKTTFPIWKGWVPVIQTLREVLSSSRISVIRSCQGSIRRFSPLQGPQSHLSRSFIAPPLSRTSAVTGSSAQRSDFGELLFDLTHSALHPQFRILLMCPHHMRWHDGLRLILNLAFALKEDTPETELGKSPIKVRRGGDLKQPV